MEEEGDMLMNEIKMLCVSLEGVTLPVFLICMSKEKGVLKEDWRCQRWSKVESREKDNEVSR